MTKERHLKTSEIPSVEVMVERVLAKLAIAMTTQRSSWYLEEHHNCTKAVQYLARQGILVSLEKFCQVVAIVSPGRKWEKNITDAAITCIAWTLPEWEDKVALFNEHNVSRRYGYDAFKRAWALLDGTYEIDREKSPKVHSFAHNLYHPETSPYVTIDQHMCHILLGEDDVFGSIGITAAQYRKLEKPIYIVADMIGMDPKRIQELIWRERVESMRTV